MATNKNVSALLGQRLLQGWTMLSDVCPNESCPGVPLMRDHENKMLCVSCDTFYVRPADVDPARHKLTPATTAPTASAPPPTTATAITTTTTNSSMPNGTDDDDDIAKFAQDERARLGSRWHEPVQPSAPAIPAAGVATPAAMEGIVAATREALLAKMDMLRGTLKTSSSLPHIRGLVETIQAITQCIIVLDKLSDK